VEAQKKRLAVCTVIWGVHGTRGMILAMPVNGALGTLSVLPGGDAATILQLPYGS